MLLDHIPLRPECVATIHSLRTDTGTHIHTVHVAETELTPLWVVSAFLWHGPAWHKSRVLKVRWHKPAVQRPASLSFAHSTSAARLSTHTYTHRFRVAKAESTAKSTYRPWEDKLMLWPNTHTHTHTHTCSQNQPRPLCGQRHLQHSPTQLGIPASGPPSLWENPSEMKERRGGVGVGVRKAGQSNIT